MENKEDILKRIAGDDPETAGEAIREIQENGDFSIMPELFGLLEKDLDLRTQRKLIELLADIRDSSFRDVITEQIRNTTNTQTKSLLLQSVWESSLDYSAYLELFTDILLHDDFSVALEASTVIENMYHQLTPEQYSWLSEQLSPDNCPADKQILTEFIFNPSATE